MTTRNSSWLLLRGGLVLLLAAAACAACATSPGVEREAKPADLEALKAVGGKAGGLVAWTSARAGQSHIFVMKTDGSDLKQVTEGPFTDWYPRISPDGKKILFSRSQKKGFVRQSEGPEAWNLFTVDVGGGEATKVVEGATWGSWASADEIVFVRGGKIVRAKLDGSEESSLVDIRRQAAFADAIVQQPQLSPDGKYLTLTLAGGRRQVGIWKIKKKVWTQVGQGAQISWAPDGAFVAWVSPTGKGLSELFRMPVENGMPAKDFDPGKLPFLDSPGKRSREAFPRVSSDGKWLVFGAAAKSLELDLEDFELYLWEVGTPIDTTARLTFHSDADSWPDIFVSGTGATPDTSGEENKETAAPAEEAKAPSESEKAEPESAPKKEEAAAPPEETPAEEEAPASKPKGKGKKKKR
jgi:hypothetical protein